MILIPSYKNKKVGVLGLGKAGIAAVESLQASGAIVYPWDDNIKSTRNKIKPDDWDWKNLSALVMSPGISLTHAIAERAKTENIPIIGEVELLYKAQPKAIFVGITGTNGKSTTTALIAHILQQAGKTVQVGGNLGVPALALEPLSTGGIYVLEMSSYQLDLCHSVRFNIACHLNLSPDHLERHGDMSGYIEAKKRIFNNQKNEDIAIIGVDDKESSELAKDIINKKMSSVIEVSIKQNKYCIESENTQLGSVRYIGEHTAEQQKKMGSFLLDLSNAQSLQGEHNRQNAYVALEACKALGVSNDDIQLAINNFDGLEHRMEWLGCKNNINYVNDSKATNADSAAKSLATYDNIFWLLGGIAKSGGINSLTPYFSKIRNAYIFGKDADLFANTLRKSQVKYKVFDNIKDAVIQAKLDAKEYVDNNREDSVILLSPAAASWDQFKNFEHRGEAFRQLTPFNNKQQNKREKAKAKQRISVVTGNILEKEDSIKLVRSPDGQIIVDIAEKLPVKAIWIEAQADKIIDAVKNGVISKELGFRDGEESSINPDKIISQAYKLITKRLMKWLSLAIRSGNLISGFTQVESAIKSGNAALLLQANDASADGVEKISRLANALSVKEYRPLSKELLSKTVNRANVVHIILLKDAIVKEIEKEIHRLTGFTKNNQL